MDDFVFKRSMNLGTGTAENDGDFLGACFVETPEYKTLVDYSDHRMILLGRTGAGKTALLKTISHKVDVFVEIRPDTFSLQYIANMPFVEKLKKFGISLEVFYKFLWVHEIVAQVIRNFFPRDKTGLIERFSGLIGFESRVSQMQKYLKENGDVFFDSNSAEKVTKELEASVKSRFLNFAEGEISANEKKEIQIAASEYVRTNQIAQLQNVIFLLKEYLSTNAQRKIFVTIDDLDMNWIADDTKYYLLSALLDSIRMFANIPGLKVVIAMRADLLEKTCIVANRQNEKDMSFTLKLNWDENLLWDVLQKRIQYLFSHKYAKNYHVMANEIFEQKVNGKAVEEYLIERTMMRPRDLITFVNLCIEHSDSQSIIKEKAIFEAERDFLHDRRKALIAEWNQIYPNIEVCLDLLYCFQNEFFFEDVMVEYQKIESSVLSAPVENDDLVRRFLDSGSELARRQNVKQFLKILYTVGVVGKCEGDRVYFSNPSRPTLDERDFLDAAWFEVHPLFKK